jgi:hypothetical protein
MDSCPTIETSAAQRMKAMQLESQRNWRCLYLLLASGVLLLLALLMMCFRLWAALHACQAGQAVR